MRIPERPDYEEVGWGLDALAMRMNWVAAQYGKGWGNDDPMTVLSFIHAEISEAFEVLKSERDPRDIWFSEDVYGNKKPEGFRVELVDALFAIITLADGYGGIGRALEAKMRYREEHGWPKASL